MKGMETIEKHWNDFIAIGGDYVDEQFEFCKKKCVYQLVSGLDDLCVIMQTFEWIIWFFNIFFSFAGNFNRYHEGKNSGNIQLWKQALKKKFQI